MTGLATATLAVLARTYPRTLASLDSHHISVTTYLARPSTNICLVFGMSVGRAATLTVLYNLNMRKSNGNYSSYYNSAGPGTSAITGGATNIPLETGFGFVPHGTQNGVNVHQMSVVHVDRDPIDKSTTTQLDETVYDEADDRYDQKHRGRDLV